MEQFVRDARIAQLYEGTNGIQALDLVGRKLNMHNGRAIKYYFELVGKFIHQESNSSDMEEFIKPLSKAFAQL